MIRRHPARLVALLFAVASIPIVAIADAYTYRTCGGVKVVWDDPFAMVRNLNSIPFNSTREDAMLVGINRWRNVGGMENMVSLYSVPSAGEDITHGNGQNDVAIVDRDDIDDNNGLTITITDGCFIAGDQEIIEADVMVASDMTWTNPSETSLTTTSGQSTFVHEFGHAHGLGHYQNYNNMRTPQPRPFIGGSGQHVDVLPDDAQGGRYLYPGSGSETNLFSSAQRRDTGTDTITTNTGAGPVYACSGGGGTLTVNATVGNNGTVNVTQTERWYVSSNSTQYGGLPVLTWSNSTFNASTAHTRQVTFSLPALNVGTYYLFHKVDTYDDVDESNEVDNVARERLVIEVISC